MREPEFNRRKQIMIGTSRKVNPTRAMARRASLICRQLGQASSYYFWLVERIGKGDSTRFKIEDAAEDMGVNRRSIERWNTKLINEGFATIRNRMYHGRQTYNEVILHEINEVIQDDGTRNARHSPLRVRGSSHATTQMSQRRYDTDVATKRAFKKKRAAPAFFTPAGGEDAVHASPLPKAGGSGPVPSVPHAFGIREGRWREVIEEILPDVPSCGFDHRGIDSIMSDVEQFDDLTPDEFLKLWKYRLLPRMRDGNFFLHRPTRSSIGLGWLFKNDNMHKVDNGDFGGTEPAAPNPYSPGDTVVINHNVPAYGIRAGTYTIERTSGQLLLFTEGGHCPASEVQYV